MTVPEKSAPRLISIAEFASRTTLCRASIYKLIASGDLPRPIQLFPTQRVAFPEHVLTDYLDRVAAESAGGEAA